MKLFLEKILFHAIEQNATDIHINLKENLNISFRILGKMVMYKDYDYENGVKLINYIKYKAHINTNDKIASMSGEFNTRINNHVYYFRVSSLPTKKFLSIVIRILYTDKHVDINHLSPCKEITSFLKSIKNYRNGLFIISGPTGSGKSTTLYSLIRYINHDKKLNVISIEDPIEIILDECLQIEINEDLGITYVNTLKQILRHDPDIIVIGEIRDEHTANMAVRCALSGHLVLATIHSSNVLTSLQRLLNMDISQFDLESVIYGILSQRMIYDYEKSLSFMIGEYINHQQCLRYLKTKNLDYKNFDYYINKLIQSGMNQSVFYE